MPINRRGGVKGGDASAGKSKGKRVPSATCADVEPSLARDDERTKDIECRFVGAPGVRFEPGGNGGVEIRALRDITVLVCLLAVAPDLECPGVEQVRGVESEWACHEGSLTATGGRRKFAPECARLSLPA